MSEIHASLVLVVKTPHCSNSDITVKCLRNWTVRMLKEHLSQVYPGRPKTDAQRIIYMGKLIEDRMTLAEMLNEKKAPLASNIIHLVVPENGFQSQVINCSALPLGTSERIVSSNNNNTEAAWYDTYSYDAYRSYILSYYQHVFGTYYNWQDQYVQHLNLRQQSSMSPQTATPEILQQTTPVERVHRTQPQTRRTVHDYTYYVSQPLLNELKHLIVILSLFFYLLPYLNIPYLYILYVISSITYYFNRSLAMLFGL